MAAQAICARSLAAILAAIWLNSAAAATLTAQSDTAFRPVTAFGAAKARELLQNHLPCLGCHTLEGSGGRIAPDLTTVRERRSREYIAAIIDDPQGTLPGSIMPKQTMPKATRDAVVRYLQSLPGSGSAGAASTVLSGTTAGDTSGASLYLRWCAACHGSSGNGDGINAPQLTVRPARHSDAGVMSSRSDDALYDTIAGGGSIMNRSPRMPAFGETLSPTEIRALVAYIRELCDCEGPLWSRDGGSLNPRGS